MQAVFIRVCACLVNLSPCIIDDHNDDDNMDAEMVIVKVMIRMAMIIHSTMTTMRVK